MAKLVRTNAKTIDRELIPAKVKAMVIKAKVSTDYNPFTQEEWWGKAEFPNQDRIYHKVILKAKRKST